MRLTGRYEIPRNFKGEDRILLIFKGKKSFFYSLTGLGVFSLIMVFFNLIKHPITGFIFSFWIVPVSYFLGTYKIPNESRNSAREDIDKHLLRIHKRKKNKVIYTSLYREED